MKTDTPRSLHRIALLAAIWMFFSLVSHAQSLQADWVQAQPVHPNLSQIAHSESFLSASTGNTFYEASLTSYVSSYSTKPMGKWTIRHIALDGTVLQSFGLGMEVSVIDILSKGSDLLIAGNYIDSLFLNDSLILNSPFPTGLSPQEFIIKIDESGNLIWVKDMYQQLNYRELQGLYLSPSEDVFYFFSEFSNYSAIVRMDADGSDLDSLLIDDHGLIWDVEMDEVGNCFVAGSSGGTWDSLRIGTFSEQIPFSYSAFVAKINPSGNADWVQFAEDVTFSPVQLELDADGNIFAAGYLSAPQSWDSFHLDGPQWVYDFFLVKMNSSGEVLWARETPNLSGGITGDFYLGDSQSMVVDDAGNAILSGILRGEIQLDTLVVQSGTLQTQGRAYVLFTPDGVPVISKVYASEGSYFSTGEIIRLDNQWINTVFVRYVDTLQIDNHLITTDFDALTLTISLSESTLVTQEQTELSRQVIYPNPASDILTISGNRQDYVYRIVNQQGQILLQGSLSGEQNQLDISSLKQGMYRILTLPSGLNAGFIKL